MNRDMSIVVVWPEYPIAVGEISGKETLSTLGHAGMVIVDGDTGAAVYTEYGRWDDPDTPANELERPGLIVNTVLPTTRAMDGGITQSDLEAILSQFDPERGYIAGSVLVSDPEWFDRALQYITDPQNSFLGTYRWQSFDPHHCYTYTVAIGNEMGTWQDTADLFYGMIPSSAIYAIGLLAGGFMYHNQVGLVVHGDGEIAPECFDASCLVLTETGGLIRIGDVLSGNLILAFDPTANQGRGALVPRKVTRLYRNTTTEWLRLTWEEDGEQKELVTTPGHHFLDQHGRFTRIDRMLQDNRATIVLADGTLAEVTAKRTLYSAVTAHLFERAVAYVDTGNGTAAKPVELDCSWSLSLMKESILPFNEAGLRGIPELEHMERMAVHNESLRNGAAQRIQGKQRDAA